MLGSSMSWYNQAGDEEILWKSNPSYVKALPFLLSGLMFFLASGIITLYLYFFTDLPELVAYGSAVLMPFGIIYSAFRMLKFKNTMYVITTRRMIIKEEIVGKATSSIPHREIQRTDIEQSKKDALLSRITSENIGDLMMYTADDEGGEFKLSNVPELDLAEQYAERLSGSNLSTHGAEEIDRVTGAGEKHTGEQNDRYDDAIHEKNQNNNQRGDARSGRDSSKENSDSGGVDVDSYHGQDNRDSTRGEGEHSDDFDEYTPSDKA